jgi:hypothetical protein
VLIDEIDKNSYQGTNIFAKFNGADIVSETTLLSSTNSDIIKLCNLNFADK